MNALARAGALLVLALASAAAGAAERAVYTIVDDDVRVLRGGAWYRLETGTRVEPGDTLDAAAEAVVQAELPGGGILRAMGPAHARVGGVPDGAARVGELTLAGGWFKVKNPEKATPMRLALPAATVDLADGIVVLHAAPALVQLFVEEGHAGVAASGARTGSRGLAEGDYWERAGERAVVSEDRAPRAFVAAMPAELRDPLPVLVTRFDGPSPVLTRTARPRRNQP
jgi:hypothetical protein